MTMINWTQLDAEARLLLEAQLKPAQGTRFQPTGFPDLGAAVYHTNDAGHPKQMALVESPQSVANRLEAVCWDEANNAVHPALDGMPFVSVSLWDSGDTTNSLLEAHRLNSPYIMRDEAFKERIRTEAKLPTSQSAGVSDRAAFAKVAFKYDPGSVLHGVFLVQSSGMTARLQRCLSGFIEAEGVEAADSGGVKNDRVAPSPGALQKVGLNVTAADGYGNVPFHRNEYTAERITAYFSIDLAQIRAYRLGIEAEHFLVTLALWKIRRFLDTGLRLRTACDLTMTGELKAARPEQFIVPDAADLEAGLAQLIKACAKAGKFAQPPVTQLTFNPKR